MKRLSSARRVIGTVLLLLFAHVLLPVSALAADSKPASADKLPLQLHKGFLRETKFSYEGGPRQKMVGFGGMSFTKEFKDVMQRHPEALREAQKSHLYMGIAMVGVAGLLVSSAISLGKSISDANEVSSGRIPDTGVESSDMVLFGVSAAVALVPLLIGAKHVSEGIRLFNEAELNQTTMPGEELISVDKSLYIDLLVGLNSASINYDPESNTESRSGFITGLLVDVHGSGSGSLQTGFLFSTKGNAAQRLSYLKFPFHYKYNFGTGNVRPYLFAGPSVNFLVSSKTEGLGLSAYSSDAEDFFPIDLALNFGGGFRLAKTPLSLSVMRSEGFLDLVHDDEGNSLPSTGVSAKNRATYIYAAYSF